MILSRSFLRFLDPVAIAAMLAATASAQSPCLAWDPAIGVPGGLSGDARAFAVFDDGSGSALFVAGMFSAAGDVETPSIAKWDGAQWSSPAGGIAGLGGISALAVFDDGQGPALYAGGVFDSVGGVAAASIARWDGTTWSALGSGIQGSVQALEAFDDGSGTALYAAGSFTVAGGTNARNVARWNGTTWSALDSGFDASARCLTVYDDGGGPMLYAGGLFTAASGVLVNGVARWNGASWSALGSGITYGLGTGAVEKLVAYDGGNGSFLIAGGIFSMAGSINAANIVRWNGVQWLPCGQGTDAPVAALAVYDFGDGPDVYVGGSFRYAGGVRVNSIARWNGFAWFALQGGTNAPVSALGSFDIGGGPKLAAAGVFSRAGEVPANRIAQWDGSSWATIDGARNAGPVFALASFDDGSGPALYTSGGYSTAGNSETSVIMKWQAGAWSPLGVGSDQLARSLVVFDDGGGTALYAAGQFTLIDGVGADRIAKWDGTSWSRLGSGTNNEINALAVFDDGQGPALYAGGKFTTAGDVPANFVARWNGSVWSALGTGVDADVFALAVFDDGSGPALYAGGQFQNAGGSPAARVAKWNGTTWSALGSGIGPGSFDGSAVTALAVAGTGAGPALYAGGSFQLAGGFPATNIARWNGTSWSALGSGTSGQVHALVAFDDGGGEAVYAGGLFVGAGGTIVNQIGKWNGSSWSSLSGGVNSIVFALAVHDDGTSASPDLYAGGFFTQAGGLTSRFLARWEGCAGPEALVCFGDGSLAPCPCNNNGAPKHGCANSSVAAGALLTASGTTQPDQVVLGASGAPASAISIFMQGTTSGVPLVFGDGLRCIGGMLKRLYTHTAVQGNVFAPIAGEPSITTRSALLGDPIAPGSTRYYQTHYRDGVASFCGAPFGNSWNVTNGVRITW